MTSSATRLILLACLALLFMPRQVRADGRGVGTASKKIVFLGMRDYIDRIVAESPKTLASRLDEAAADYAARSAYASYLPHLTVDGRIGYIHGERLSGLSGSDQAQVGVDTIPDHSFTQEGPVLTIPIFKDGSFLGLNVPPEVARLRAERRAVNFNGSLTMHDLVFSATEAYLNAIKAAHLLELRRQHFVVAKKEAARVEDRASDSLATADEVGAARLTLETSRASFEAERGEAVYSILAVADLLGLSGNQIRIQEDYPQPAPLPDFGTVARRSSVDHPRVHLQEALIDRAKANVALQRSRRYPKVNALSYDFQYGDFNGNASNQWVSFMAISVPVFDFGEAAFATRSASLKMRAEKERFLSVQQEVRKDLLDAFVDVKQSESAFAKAGSAVAEQQRITNRLQEQVKDDQALLSDLNSAEMKLLDSKEELEQAHYDLLFQYARVERLAAGAWEWVPR